MFSMEPIDLFERRIRRKPDQVKFPGKLVDEGHRRSTDENHRIEGTLIQFFDGIFEAFERYGCVDVVDGE